ncbi:EAL domain-containing protein [Paraburkholderia sp. J10-1]|uniref:EAL domain-containing protein n=1 Tax=Paraburkholderia sp. J10-1 TaxID=2805430 RepID=UPI002AB63A6B|nr:EAL domain-containing protein [Paraburkholderia sp. J10-1]
MLAAVARARLTHHLGPVMSSLSAPVARRALSSLPRPFVRVIPAVFDSRRIAVVTTAVVGTLTIVLLAGIAFGFVRAQIMREEFAKLNVIAAEVLERSERSSAQVRAAIAELQAHDAAPCSPEQLALMAELNLKYGQLQGVGYVANNRLMCSSYGRHGDGILLPVPTSQHTARGLLQLRKANLSLASSVRSQPVIMVTSAANGYTAIVSPSLPIDVDTKDPNVALGTVLYSSNEVRMSRGKFNPNWHAMLGDGQHAEFIADDRIVSLWRSPRYDYFAFASIPADAANARIHQAGIVLMSCAVCAMVVLMFLTWRSARKALPLSEAIREGLRRKEFYLVYQPLVDLKTLRWVGAEALLRWRRSTGEHVRPDIFIPVAEDCHLIEEITDHVFELAATDLAGFFEKYPDFHVAINLSASEMQSPHVVPRLKNFIERVTGARARNFVFEATERSLIKPDQAGPILAEIRGMGSTVAIDDFGTGYSSLSYLQTLGTDYLKIDKSFVDAIDTASVKNHVVAHIIGLGKDLRLRLIAEGVETAEQARYLSDRGVEFAQGWHFAKAMAIGELADSLNRQVA